MEGFLLGLSSGTSCLVHCAPVIVPYILKEGNNTRNNCLSISVFLSGRLVGYLIFGANSWLVGSAISDFPVFRSLLFGIIFVLLSFLLAYSALSHSSGQCPIHRTSSFLKYTFCNNRWMVTILLGLFTGISFCPPFLLAFSSTASSASLTESLFYFFTFFLGTTLYFIPIAFLGVLNNKKNMKIIGRMMSVIMAAYFMCKGVSMIGNCLI